MNRTISIGLLGLLFASSFALVFAAAEQPKPVPTPVSQPTKSKTEIYQVWPFDAKEAAKRQDETAKALGVQNEIAVDLGNKISIKFVLIPAGKFMMGSPKDEAERFPDEGPQHEVTISKPFYMGIYCITQEQYKQVMGNNPSEFKGMTSPVEMVSWYDAVQFCRKLSQKTAKTVALPTEAQWEYACRAGTNTPFNTGENINTDQANYNGLYPYRFGQKGEYRHDTIAVGSFKPNAFGLYDMHGNINQLCADWYDKNYYSTSPKTDPQGPARGNARILRGGDYHSPARFCRSAGYRGSQVPGIRPNGSGFRVVMSGR